SPERGKIVFKHNVRGLLRGDLAAQSAFYREMINCGAYCINEVRAFEDLPPIAGGDTYFIPSTMVPLERAADPARNTPVALPPPASPSPEEPDAESPSETEDESD
ncbi:MAG TPA: hypothetical protein PKG51_11505, partial [Arachnia sp.]|nr:hypothetical protein [Arachnia sp.]